MECKECKEISIKHLIPYIIGSLLAISAILAVIFYIKGKKKRRIEEFDYTFDDDDFDVLDDDDIGQPLGDSLD